jgi:hypothetical protein
MNDPRRTDDARLSTADLAAAGERANERENDRAVDQANAQRQAQAAQQAQSAQQAQAAARAQSDRDVTRDVQRAQRDQQAATAAGAAANRQASEQERPSPMFGQDETNDFHQRWVDIQTGFVDEPRQAVERADALVAAAIKRLAESFAQERSTLEQQWARGADVSTEDLRLALRKYRGFFDRLLSV